MASAGLDLAVASRPLGDCEVEKRQLPSLSMAFVGSAARHRGHNYALEAIARGGLITFQSGPQPHRNLLKLLKSVGDAEYPIAISIERSRDRDLASEP